MKLRHHEHRNHPLREMTLCFEELALSSAPVLSEMGYPPGHTPTYIEEAVTDTLRKAGTLCDIRSGLLRFDRQDFTVSGPLLRCAGTSLEIGPSLVPFFASAAYLYVTVTTIGPGLEQWSRACFAAHDPISGYVADIVGTCAVEYAAAHVLSLIEAEAHQESLMCTPLYSPGYCEWPTHDQHRLFSLLPPRFLDIAVSASALMHPLKTVSGCVAVGVYPQKPAYLCARCTNYTCYRKKARCGGTSA